MNDESNLVPTALASAAAVLLGLAVLLVGGLWRLAVWIRQPPDEPDPWTGHAEADLSEDSRPLCTRCLAPHTEADHFCANCGRAVQPVTNLMPYLDSLSLGDVLRHGTAGQIPLRPVAIVGYVLMGLCQYMIFAPVYWWQLWRNVQRLRHPPATESDCQPLPG